MASATSVQALIRALKPTFRSLEEKVVFAVHAVITSNGLRLLAVGPASENPDAAAAAAGTEEASLEGWNTLGVGAQGGAYSFLYAVDPPLRDPGGAHTPLLLAKCILVDGSVLVSMLADPTAATAQPLTPDPAVAAQPSTVELEAAHFSLPGDLSTSGYRNLEQLVDRVQSGLGMQVLTSASNPSAQAAQQPSHQQLQQQQQLGQQQPRPPPKEPFDPLRDYSQPSRAPPFDPSSVGRGDVMPGGLPDHPGHGGWGGPGGDYEGMLVGPSNFPGRGRQPPGSHPSPSTLPPGARWDPIAPEGLQGWNPDDFTRERMRQSQRQGVPDPDIMQPGAGRGPDFDAMFG